MDAMSHAKEEREEVRQLTQLAMDHSQTFDTKCILELVGRAVMDHSSVAVMAAHSHTQLTRVAEALEGINDSLKILIGSLTQR